MYNLLFRVLNPVTVYLCGSLGSTCSYSEGYIFFSPPFSSSIKTNPASLISFLLAPATTGPQWPFLAGCVCVCVSECVFVDVCGGSTLVMCAFTWLQSACDREHACVCVCVCVCVAGSADMIVCDRSSLGGRLLSLCERIQGFWHLSSFLSPVTCFMTSC